MLQQTVFEKIQEMTGNLTKSEKKVARVLLSDYPASGLITVAELSNRCAVSGQTVIRFVSKIGFESYPQFQNTLIEELKVRNQSPLSQFSRKKGGLKRDHLIDNSLKSYQASIEETIGNLAPSELNDAINLITDSKHSIITTGGRFSDLMADYLYRHLNLLRPDTRYQDSNPISRADILVDIGKKTVLVIYDVRRYQSDTIQFAQQAYDRGASIILITDPYLSPICQFAKVVLPAEVEMFSPFDSHHSLLMITEILVAGILEKLNDQGRSRIEEIEQSREAFLHKSD